MNGEWLVGFIYELASKWTNELSRDWTHQSQSGESVASEIDQFVEKSIDQCSCLTKLTPSASERKYFRGGGPHQLIQWYDSI